MILIGGCSWACGEWNRGDLDRVITHTGITQCILDQGQTCVNLGIPAGSNLQVSQKIRGWIERYPERSIEKILIFQTEYTRDFHMKFDEDYNGLENFDILPGRMISRFYYRLVEISQLAKCPVYLIGGVSDTFRFPDFEKCYPGVKIACQSMVNLLINDNENVDNPVLSWYTNNSLGILEEMKKRLPQDQLEYLFIEMDRGLERENLVFGCPEYFWPDGSHPNRHGHKKLFDFLCKKGVL